MFGARFVALFHWASLVLLALPPCRGVGLNDSVSYAFITEVTDSRRLGRALLGILLFSYRNSAGAESGELNTIQTNVFPAYSQAYHRRVEEEAKHNTTRRQHPRGLNNNTSYLKIEPQQPLSGSQRSI